MSSAEENLELQLSLLEQTWEAFVSYGVTDGTPLILDFTYNAPDKKRAKALAEALSNMNAKVVSEGVLKKSYSVLGSTGAMEVTHDLLHEWVTAMVQFGWTHDCEFDGFGAALPETDAEDAESEEG